MKTIIKRTLSLLLAIVLVFGVAPLDLLYDIDLESLTSVKVSAVGVNPLWIDSFYNNTQFQTYEQYNTLCVGKISMATCVNHSEVKPSLYKSYELYYKFTNGKTVVYVHPDAFFGEANNIYTSLNSELSSIVNTESAENTGYPYRSKAKSGTQTVFKNLPLGGKIQAFDIDYSKTYIAWLRFDINRNNENIDLSCKKRGHVTFTIYDKVVKEVGSWNVFVDKYKLSDPTTPQDYLEILKREVYNQESFTAITPIFELNVDKIGDCDANGNYATINNARFRGRGVKNSTKYILTPFDKIDRVLKIADTGLSIACVCMNPADPKAWYDLVKNGVDLAKTSHEDAELRYENENPSSEEYHILETKYFQTNGKICLGAILFSPRKVKADKDMFIAELKLSGEPSTRGNKTKLSVKFSTVEDGYYNSSSETPMKPTASGAYKNTTVTPTKSTVVKFGNLKSSSVEGKSAKVSGTIKNVNSQKILNYGIYLKKGSDDFSSKDIVWSNKNATTKSTINIERTLTGLEPDTKYYYAIYANTAYGSYCSDIKSFKTKMVKPESTKITSIKTIDYRNNAELNSSELGVGDSVKVKWDKAKYAEYYTIKVNGVEDKTKIYGTEKVIKLDKVGANTISVCAHNKVGSSAWTDGKTATVHKDVILDFIVTDSNGVDNVYETHTLTWNHDLQSMPVVPSRVGSTFSGWYKGGESTHAILKNIKENTTVYARYSINEYTVKFVDNKGNDIPVTLSDGTTVTQQKVKYGEAAVPPKDEDVPVSSGYKFVGWNTDYTYINTPMTIRAVVDKENYDRPVRISAGEAIRYDGRYEVTCTVENETLAKTQGRVVIALKTDAGHLITTTESTVYFVEQNTGETIDSEKVKNVKLKVLIPIDELMDAKGLIADYAEIYAVENFKTTVPVAEHYTVRVKDYDEWSAWSTINPTGMLGVGEIQHKKQYASRELMVTTVNTTTERNALVAAGWDFYGTTGPEIKTGGWTKTKPAALEYRVINTKTVTDYKSVKKYCYKRYAYKNNGTWWSYGSTWATNNGYSGKWEYLLTDKPLEEYKSYDGRMAYGNKNDYWWKANVNTKQGTKYTTETTTVQVKSGSHIEYQAVDTIYTYHLQKWQDEFSDFSDNFIQPDSTTEVITQDVYRYKTDLPKRSSTDTTNIRDDFACGYLGTEYAGKEVTLFIYKVTEASDWTTEYVAQTTVDKYGNYYFEPYMLREEPTAITGDFTVTLGIEGADSSIYLGKIEVPDSEYQYTVTYMDKDSNVIDTQIVSRHEDAVPPEAPVYEGYTFSHWDTRSTDVQSDLIIHAEYTQNVYNIIYVNIHDETSPVSVCSVAHGEELIPPEAPEEGSFDTEQYTFIGWDAIIAGEKTAKSNMIITAVYEEKTYNVTFEDISQKAEDEIVEDSVATIEVQPVEYGDAPVDPNVDFGEDVVFYGWSLATQDSSIIDLEDLVVTEDVSLTPIYSFMTTTEAPYASVSTGSYGSAQKVTLNCDTENAYIYYTIDGSDPISSETAIECEPGSVITIADTCQLRFVAGCFNMNMSSEMTETYVINNGTETDKRILKIGSFDNDSSYGVYIVESGKTISEDLVSVPYGYTLSEVYCEYTLIEDEENSEIEYSDPWNFTSNVVTEDMVLYPVFVPELFNVMFVDYDGFVLSEQEVYYLDYAVEPEYPSREGYVFTGWDTADYNGVTEDVVINAVYVPEDEYVTIKLDRSNCSLMNGNSCTLEATTGGNIENPELIWASTDGSVAIVDENGRVTAVGKGTAEIYAIVVDNGETAVCTVTVSGNPSEELIPVVGSYLSIGTDGYIRGFNISTDEDTQLHHAETVADIKAQFMNNNIVFIDINGNTLDNSDYVGTGTVIKFMNGTEVMDSLTVVVSGDMDGDGCVTNRDASRITRYLVNKENPNEAQLYAMDVNADGYVNNRDASIVSRYLVGKETL